MDIHEVVDGLPDMVWTATPDGHADFLNRRWSEYTGMSDEEAAGFGWVSAVHPDDQVHVLECWTALIESGQAGDVEARFRRFDGDYRWFLFRASPLRDDDGTITRWCGTNIDIADRKQAERQLSAEKSLLEMIVAGRPLNEILGAVCRFVEEISPGCLACIFPIDRRRLVLKPGVAPSLPASFMTPLEKGPPKGGKLPCGLAVEKDRRIIVSDIETDPMWRGTEYGNLMIAHGLRSVWSTPIRSLDGRILGALSVYQTRPATPSSRQRDLIFHATQVAAIALDRFESDEALRAREVELERTYRHLTQAQRLSRTGSFTAQIEADENIWSDELYRILEIDPATSGTFRAFRDMHHPDDRERFNAAFRDSLKEGVDFDQTFRIVTSSGAVKHLHTTAQLSRDPPDGPAFIGAIQDVTESKLVEEALTASEAELRRTNRYLTDAQRLSRTGSFTLDPVSGAQDWSDELFRICDLDRGVPPSFVQFLAMLHPDDAAAVDAAVKHAFETDTDFDVSYRIRTRTGSVKHLHSVGQRVREIGDRHVYVGATQDVTDRILGEEALNTARMELAHVSRITALSTLTASIAHEVNQPLAGILTNASTCLRMLAADPPDLDGARATAQRTIRDGNRASEVIKRLRALFARRPARTEPVDLNDAAREVLALSSSEAQRARTIVQTRFGEDLPPIAGDRVQLQQVVLNLVLNAIEAMREIDDRPHELVLATAWDPNGQEVRLSVHDAGVGAEAEKLETMFDAFYTTKPEGMGVGLSVSRSIIEAHSGRLWANRNAEGPGLTVSFALPVTSSPDIDRG